jgi:hypothetical protein
MANKAVLFIKQHKREAAIANRKERLTAAKKVKAKAGEATQGKQKVGPENVFFTPKSSARKTLIQVYKNVIAKNKTCKK